jgi:hypothetical protein
MGLLKSFFQGIAASQGDVHAIIDGAIKPISLVALEEYKHHRKTKHHEDALDCLAHNMCRQLKLDRQMLDAIAKRIKENSGMFGPRTGPFGSDLAVEGPAKDWLAFVWAVHEQRKVLPDQQEGRDYIWGWFRNYFHEQIIFRLDEEKAG